MPPTIQVADRVIGESHGGGGGPMTTADILAQSSNVGTVMIGLKLGATRFDRWVRRFGFAKPTGVDLPGENRGIVLDVDDYSGSSIGNMPIGQGLSVTPIQMASAYTAIANGGLKRQPYIVAGDQEPPQRVLSERTAERGLGDARGRAQRRAARRRRPPSTATRWPARPVPPRRPRTAPTPIPTSWPRSSATRRPRTPACWCR